jgi:hypothetical protein
MGPWAAGMISDAVGGDGALSLRIGPSVTILTGIPAAIMLWRSAHHLDADRRSLAG